MSLDFDSALDGLDSPRREFLSQLVTDSAFSGPVVSSFTMSGISRAYAGAPGASNSNFSGG